MNREDVYKKLNDVFREVFDEEEIIVTDNTTAKDIDNWDSLMHITLVSEIEDEFGIHFQMKDVNEMSNVGQMVDKILGLI